MNLVELTDAITHLEQTLSELTQDDTIRFAGEWRLTESYDICNNYFKVHYATVTLTYDNGQYTFHEDFINDIELGGREEGDSIRNCKEMENEEADDNDVFSADEYLTGSAIKALMDDSEVRSVIINSSDQFTVMMRFRTGLENEFGIDVTQIWTRQ